MKRTRIKQHQIYFILSSVVMLLIVTIGNLFLGTPSSIDNSSIEHLLIKERLVIKNPVNLLEIDFEFEEEFEDTSVKDNSYDLSWEDFMYLCTLEEAYRNAYPMATSDEVASYLNIELENLINNNQNIFNPMNSGISEMFGINLTAEEISLFVAYPVQAVQAYNASRDAISKGEEFYVNSNKDNLNPNAFRHGYWNALMEKRISKDYRVNLGTQQYPWYTTIRLDFAKMFADAHEYGTSGPSTDMDYLNNALGRVHGATYKDLSDHNMAVEMTKRIANGEFYRNISGAIVASNWEELKPQILYDTSPITGGVRINSVLYNINSALKIPPDINGQTVVAIGILAFLNQTQMSQITIPLTVTTIGSDAFKNTNHVPIYLTGRTKAPSTFGMNWNSSANPVYLNGILCQHTSVTKISLSDAQHGDLCNDCRTIINKANHRKYTSNGWQYCSDCSHSKYVGHTHIFSGPYIQAGEAGHLASCSCGVTSLQAHIAGIHEPGDRYVNCMRCGYLIDLWSGGPIIIMRHDHSHEDECTHDDHLNEAFDDMHDMMDVCCNNMVAIVKKEKLYED